MTDPQVAIFMLSLFIFLVLLGFPIAFTLIAMGVGFGYYAYFQADNLLNNQIFYLLNQNTYSVMENDVLVAIPLFLFMGYVVERANIVNRLFFSLQLATRHLPGSMAVAALATCAIFATASGIIGAVVTLMGLLAFPAMVKAGYDRGFASGVICAGGTLGILIPPSIMLVVMGPIMEIPVTDLFAAAIIPGILLATLYAAYTTVRCWIDPSLGPVLPVELRATSVKAVWIEFFLGLVPPAALVFSALGSILFGFATPTEAAGCGAMGSLLLALAYKKLTLVKLQEALVKTLEISALIMVLVAASNFFGAVFSRLGTPMLLTEFLLNLEMNRYLILAMIMAMIFLLGWPLEWVPIVMIIVPIILPLVEALGFNLTWFAILVAVNLQTAWLSPPVALSAYFLKGVVPEWDLKDIYHGMMQFMVIQVIGLILIIIFPQIALWLPVYLYGQ